MNILVLGGGGREHALAWKIRQSPLCEKLYVAPGNAGTAELCENIPLDPTDHAALIEACRSRAISFVVVGSDDALASGAVDALSEVGILAFGPMKAAAQIEWSKAYAKQLMQEEGIPTAASRTFTDFEEARAYLERRPLPIVIKASGLALGKGVVIARTKEEALAALTAAMRDGAFGAAGEEVVIEEFMEGAEISVHALCAGTDAILFPSAQDHKRAFENDEGPNTGGMGTIAPVPGIPSETVDAVRERIILPLLRALEKRGRSFSGLLFPGIMLTAGGPKVIEFNARFGDPETESYMRLLASDIVPALLAVARGSVAEASLEWSAGYAACVMVASGGYPGPYEKGKEISGLAEAETNDVVVFQAGTTSVGEAIRTNGGRVLGVTATGATLEEALERAYAGVGRISFDGMHYRKDIGRKALRAIL